MLFFYETLFYTVSMKKQHSFFAFPSIRFIFQHHNPSSGELFSENIESLSSQYLMRYTHKGHYDSQLIQNIQVLDRTVRDPQNPELDNTKRKHENGREMIVKAVLMITYVDTDYAKDPGTTSFYTIDENSNLYWWDTENEQYKDEHYLSLKNDCLEKNPDYERASNYYNQAYESWKKKTSRSEQREKLDDLLIADELLTFFPDAERHSGGELADLYGASSFLHDIESWEERNEKEGDRILQKIQKYPLNIFYFSSFFSSSFSYPYSFNKL